MKLLDELKAVNPKTPGEWPQSVKLFSLSLIFLLVIVLGALLDWQSQWDTLSAYQAEEATLKTVFLEKKGQAINLDLIKKQMQATELSFGALLKQLPNKSEMDALLTDINQAGLGRGLQFELFRPAPEVITGVFAEQPIAIRVTGSYDDIGHFTSDLAQLSRIVTLNDIAISQNSSGVLGMDATAKTYRYLDDAEVAAQKKAAKAAGGAK
jgi:type IV pilus assembly protein PilO